jgi:U-box domain
MDSIISQQQQETQRSTKRNRFGIGRSTNGPSYGRVAMHHHDDEKEEEEAEMVELDNRSPANMEGTQLVEDYDANFLSTFTIGDDDDDYDDNNNLRGDTFDLEHDDDNGQHVEGNNLDASPLSPLSIVNNEDRPPPNYLCPLTLLVMDDPVNDGCGHCFERRAILDWLEYRDVCPISRKPIAYDSLFRNGHLKARIQQWKEDHPLYQHLDEHYADHQVRNMLTNDRRRHSNFELMLLPQERQVLNIVKVRAQSRRKREEFTKCLWSVGITITIFVVGATILALIMFRKELKGPI